MLCISEEFHQRDLLTFHKSRQAFSLKKLMNKKLKKNTGGVRKTVVKLFKLTVMFI